MNALARNIRTSQIDTLVGDIRQGMPLDAALARVGIQRDEFRRQVLSGWTGARAVDTVLYRRFCQAAGAALGNDPRDIWAMLDQRTNRRLHVAGREVRNVQ